MPDTLALSIIMSHISKVISWFNASPQDVPVIHRAIEAFTREQER